MLRAEALTIPGLLRADADHFSIAPMMKLFSMGLAALMLVGCASRPVNPPITSIKDDGSYKFENIYTRAADKENLVVLAFSGGGTRAAAFSYGVLEFLRRTELIGPTGQKKRLLDEVDVISGVSGGSFTALSYGLYGEKLFSTYEKQFLKRNVQGEIISRVLDPMYWPSLSSDGWGRSELAAQLYDEILFHGATFADLRRDHAPFIMTSATDLASGSRFGFNQRIFDVICSDLNAVPLSRAAAASSAVPVVLSPVTFNNYGGTCGWEPVEWMKPLIGKKDVTRPAARATTTVATELALSDGKRRPYIHLVDGGVSDNVAMGGVLDALELLEALYDSDVPTPLDQVRRVIVFIVNSLSEPDVDWDKSERPPNSLTVLLKAAGTPIDHFSYEAIEQLKDIAYRWEAMQEIRASLPEKELKNPRLAKLLRTPKAEIYAIDVSFKQLQDKEERYYLNQQPTSFVLPDEAVDRLRQAAGTIIMNSPEFQRLLKALDAKVQPAPEFVREPRRDSALNANLGGN